MQKAWQTWTFEDFGQDGRAGGDATDCAGVGFGAILPLEAAGGCKTVAGAYFRGRPV